MRGRGRKRGRERERGGEGERGRVGEGERGRVGEGEGERGRVGGRDVHYTVLETIKSACNKKKEMYILTCKRWASEGLLNI